MDPSKLSVEERDYCARYFGYLHGAGHLAADSRQPAPLPPPQEQYSARRRMGRAQGPRDARGRAHAGGARTPALSAGPGAEIYIHTEDILLEHVEDIFKNYRVLEKVVFRITRNADINPDDEAFDPDSDDFRKTMRRAIRQRMRLAPVRLELSRR